MSEVDDDYAQFDDERDGEFVCWHCGGGNRPALVHGVRNHNMPQDVHPLYPSLFTAHPGGIYRPLPEAQFHGWFAEKEQQIATLKDELGRETALRRSAEAHAKDLVAALGEKPYPDEYDALAEKLEDAFRQIASLTAELKGANELEEAALLADPEDAARPAASAVPSELEIAERIAREAHTGQKDTVTGDDYIHHIERVVALVDGDKAKAVAWLHDVLEDNPDWTRGRLVDAGISMPAVAAVALLTRDSGDSYRDYIDAIIQSGDALAHAVKVADLQDHLRPNCPERLRPRYLAALTAFERAVPPGVAGADAVPPHTVEHDDEAIPLSRIEDRKATP